VQQWQRPRGGGKKIEEGSTRKLWARKQLQSPPTQAIKNYHRVGDAKCNDTIDSRTLKIECFGRAAWKPGGGAETALDRDA
jgi:hypothetical protein